MIVNSDQNIMQETYNKIKATISNLIFISILLCFNSFATTTIKNNPKNNFDLAQIIRSIALIYTDDKLNPEVEEFLNNKHEIIWEDNAYVYLWGMDKKTDDPYKIGQEVLLKILDENKLFHHEKHPYNNELLDEYQHYETPNNDLLCEKHKKSCFHKIIQNSDDIIKLVKKYSLPIDRYLKFLKFNHYKQISGLLYDSPAPPYRFMIVGQRLYHLSLIQELNSNSNFKIIDELNIELTYIKQKLKRADDLLSKMIMVAILAENIEFFNLLYQNNLIKLNSKHVYQIFQPLTMEEMSTYAALKNDHYMILKSVYSICKNPEILFEKSYKLMTIRLFKLLAFFVIKPNLSVNTQYFKVSKPILEIIKLTQKQFYIKQSQFNKKVTHNNIRNYVGSKYFNIESIDYLGYQARVFDLDMKIQLMRLLIQSESIDNLKTGDKFLSSYDQTKAFIKNEKICYSGLTENSEEYRCLLIN